MKLNGNLLKLLIVCLFCVGFAAYTLSRGSSVGAFSGGPDPGLTGAPGESDCTSCHGGGPLGGTLAISGLSNYAPNQELTITVTLTQANRNRYGFQLTALSDGGNRVGDLSPSDGRTQTQTANQRQYINHTIAGVTPSGTGVGTWTFKWKAPAQSVGRVTFYVAGNAANGNFNTTGDTIYTTNQSIQPATLAPVASVSAASFFNPGVLTSEAITAAFGSGLSQNTVIAANQPLPFELDGVEVKVKDANSAERNAPLFFVSPGQINYLIPAGTSAGTATVTIKRSGNDLAQGTVPIEEVGPGLFSASSDGKGVAAANVLRVKANGEQIFEPIAVFNSTTGKFDSIPVDLGPETEQVFFIGYGTGFRAAGPLSQLSSTIGGTAATVLGVAAVQGFTGLDQVNIGPIPRGLIGRGNVDIVFTANGKTANTVTMNIK